MELCQSFHTKTTKHHQVDFVQTTLTYWYDKLVSKATFWVEVYIHLMNYLKSHLKPVSIRLGTQNEGCYMRQGNLIQSSVLTYGVVAQSSEPGAHE